MTRKHGPAHDLHGGQPNRRNDAVSILEDVMEFWHEHHEAGTCGDAEKARGARCLFCEANARGVSVYSLMED